MHMGIYGSTLLNIWPSSFICSLHLFQSSHLAFSKRQSGPLPPKLELRHSLGLSLSYFAYDKMKLDRHRRINSWHISYNGKFSYLKNAWHISVFQWGPTHLLLILEQPLSYMQKSFADKLLHFNLKLHIKDFIL